MTGVGRLTPMRAVTVCLSLVLALLVAPFGSTASAGVLKVGDRLAELDIAVNEANKPFKLKSLRGKWVLVTIGAEWCKPCKKELPTWDKLAGSAGIKGKITFIALNVDEEIATGRRFHQKLKIKNMMTVYMPEDRSSVAPTYGAATMPTTFIADPQGVVRYVHQGFAERDPDGEYKKLQATLIKLLKP